MKKITIKGARVNNLKNIDLEIPINKITSFIGPSGSGKTSIAFHTLFSESKRRFLNSFPTYLKFFSDRPAPVDVDKIEPVLPVFGLPQINPISGTRSTASDIMQITSELQTVYSTFSKHYCPNHILELKEFNFDNFLEKEFKDVNESEVFYLFISKENFVDFFRNLPYPSRSIKSKRMKSISDFDESHEYWEIVRFKWKSVGKVHKKIENYLKKPISLYLFRESEKKLKVLSFEKNRSCPKCDYSQNRTITPYYFSPYNALGACQECNGFGNRLIYDPEKYINMHDSINNGAIKMLDSNRFSHHKKHFLNYCKKNKISKSKPISELGADFFTELHVGSGDWVGINKFFRYLESKRYKAPVRIYIRGIQKEELCPVCEGARVNKSVHNFSLKKDKNFFYKDIWNNTINELLKKLKSIETTESFFEKKLDKMISTLELANSIGLGHLVINRKAKTLSSGEYQRLLLLKYLSYRGTGGLFIFDEPSLGLDDRECEKLLAGFNKLIDQKNTVVLIEHNSFLINNSDHIIEMGPGAGKFGGEVIFEGRKKLKKEKVEIKPLKVSKSKDWIKVNTPKMYGKTFPSFKVPKNEFTLMTGPSGSGKTSAIVNNLAAEALRRIRKLDNSIKIGDFKSIEFEKDFSDVVVIDSNLNRYSSRSSVGSLTGLVSMIRRHYLKLKEANAMGIKDGHLSSNSVLGQCPECMGKGVKVVEMQFLEDVVLICEDCNGKKIKPIYADLSDGEKTYYESVSGPLNEVLERVDLTPKFKKIWEFMKLLNLDYLSLDRTIQSLSGGEKQRIYLLSKLSAKIENNLLVFENISFGLSSLEQKKLALFLQKLSLKNTIIVIDQSEILKNAASNLITY